ncbi:MAG: hypothetical protein M3R22_02855, partial [Pseudomonadota bacterium]|nr:hypothetical protein [Pseudomonadota bacterium]
MTTIRGGQNGTAPPIILAMRGRAAATRRTREYICRQESIDQGGRRQEETACEKGSGEQVHAAREEGKRGKTARGEKGERRQERSGEKGADSTVAEGRTETGGQADSEGRQDSAGQGGKGTAACKERRAVGEDGACRCEKSGTVPGRRRCQGCRAGTDAGAGRAACRTGWCRPPQTRARHAQVFRCACAGTVAAPDFEIRRPIRTAPASDPRDEQAGKRHAARAPQIGSEARQRLENEGRQRT